MLLGDAMAISSFSAQSCKRSVDQLFLLKAVRIAGGFWNLFSQSLGGRLLMESNKGRLAGRSGMSDFLCISAANGG